MATSTTEPAGRRHVAAARAGFTLVEVLVVVVIIALLASLVAVKLAPDTRQSLREEALRLAALLAHARDEAIVTGAPLAWQRTERGYRFLHRTPDRTWAAVDRDPSLRAREFPPGVGVAAIETAPAAAPSLIVLAPTGLSEPFRITLGLGEHRVRVSSDGAGAPVVE
jgi:general secretion pathway protein H